MFTVQFSRILRLQLIQRMNFSAVPGTAEKKLDVSIQSRDNRKSTIMIVVLKILI